VLISLNTVAAGGGISKITRAAQMKMSVAVGRVTTGTLELASCIGNGGTEAK
jgi:hypothetical protein